MSSPVDRFAYIASRDDEVQFSRAEKLATMTLSPHWQNRFLEWSNAVSLAERYSLLPEGFRGPHHQAVMQAFRDDAERQLQLLKDCEAIGRRMFRAAIVEGELTVRSSVPQETHIPGTNGFQGVQLLPPEDAEWINESSGAFMAIRDRRSFASGSDGWAIVTHFDKEEFDKWLEKAKKAPRPKPKRATRESKVTRLVLCDFYKPDGNIGFDTPDEAAEKTITFMAIAGAPPPDGPREKQLETISKRIERDQIERGYR
jgi:hypothetical protein